MKTIIKENVYVLIYLAVITFIIIVNLTIK